MPSIARSPARPRSWFWLAAWAVLASELLAFYLLCLHQVQRAEVRRQVTQVESLAFSDCLAYVHGSTIASCGRQMVVGR